MNKCAAESSGQWGGKRMPGPGKKLGRPTREPGVKRVVKSIRLPEYLIARVNADGESLTGMFERVLVEHYGRKDTPRSAVRVVPDPGSTTLSGCRIMAAERGLRVQSVPFGAGYRYDVYHRDTGDYYGSRKSARALSIFLKDLIKPGPKPEPGTPPADILAIAKSMGRPMEVIDIVRIRRAAGMGKVEFDQEVVRLALDGKVYLHRCVHPGRAESLDELVEYDGGYYVGVVVRGD